MQLDVENKVALVTGASRGIGKAIVAALAGAGAEVMLTSRKKEALDDAAAEIVASGAAKDGQLATYAANAGEPDDIAACVAATRERFGQIDILVNNAATNPYMGAAIDIDLPRFDKTWQVNYRGPVVWAQEVWKASMKEHGGVILNVSSIGGLTVEPGIGHYNVTKAALVHLTKTMAGELAPKVRVNAVAPGLVKTDFARALWEPNEDGVARHVPLRRLGEPEDIAKAALFLCSDASSWVTGETLTVDGGSLVSSAAIRPRD
jgi:NAD(P)-dependent dehydrogenase (short-subunit alcohol dehydrogenase family)